MTDIGTTTAIDLPIFHPAAGYSSPDDVLNDRALSVGEKRIILSSWASDMYAVESCPALREVPGIGHRTVDRAIAENLTGRADAQARTGGKGDAAKLQQAIIGERPAGGKIPPREQFQRAAAGDRQQRLVDRDFLIRGRV